MTNHATLRAPHQLALPFPTVDPADRLATQADSLEALRGALRLLLAVADGRAEPDPATVAEVHAALAAVAGLNIGGRLGRVVRRFHADPPTETCWAELAGELAFAVSLYQEGPTP